MNYLHLIEPIIRSLMGKEISRLEDWTAQLVVENQALGGHPYGFFYYGIIFSHYERRHTASEGLKAIDSSLTPQAHALHTATQKRRSDEQKLRQTLSVLLSRCRTRQDARDSLPEILAKSINELKTLPRERPEGFIIAKSTYHINQFNVAMDIVNYYTFNKMVY